MTLADTLNINAIGTPEAEGVSLEAAVTQETDSNSDVSDTENTGLERDVKDDTLSDKKLTPMKVAPIKSVSYVLRMSFLVQSTPLPHS